MAEPNIIEGEITDVKVIKGLGFKSHVSLKLDTGRKISFYLKYSNGEIPEKGMRFIAWLDSEGNGVKFSFNGKIFQFGEKNENLLSKETLEHFQRYRQNKDRRQGLNTAAVNLKNRKKRLPTIHENMNA